MLAELYPNTPTAELAQVIGRTVRQIYGMAKRLGIGKSAEYLASPAASRLRRGDEIGKAYRFPRGHIPANKGKKGMPSVGRMAETQFKKGLHPRSWKPIGSDRLSKEGYVQVKMIDTGYPPRDWVCLHQLVWELHYGAVPEGYRVTFKDRNKTHIAIENLELKSLREMMLRNTIHNLPKEIVEVMQLRGALNRKINHRTRKEANEQRDDH